jgi:hypothetical protein
MLEKLNKLYIGVIVGFALPIILFLIFYLDFFVEFWDAVYQTKSGEFHRALPAALPVLLTRIIFPNALIFFFCTWKNLLKAAKGLLITTAALTGILVIIEFAF